VINKQISFIIEYSKENTKELYKHEISVIFKKLIEFCPKSPYSSHTDNLFSEISENGNNNFSLENETECKKVFSVLKRKT